MATPTPQLRPATRDDEAAIEALMKASIASIFPRFYDARQTEASIRYVGVVDSMLVDDGTYFVIEVDGEIVACGGWSRRDRLYAGSLAGADEARLLDPLTEPARIRAMFVRDDWTRRGLGRRILAACEAAAKAEGFTMLALKATLPGVPLYEACGFWATDHVDIELEDGTPLACASMEMPIA